MPDVVVRSGRAADVTAVTDIYNHYVSHTMITFDTVPVTVAARAEWLAHYADSGPHRLLVALLDGAVVGYATSSRFGDRPGYATSIQTSAYCAANFTGRGIGTRLYTALFDAVRDEDLHRAYAGIALPNAASEAFHRRFGFRDIGIYHEVGRKFGRFWDVLWLEKSLP
jgi:phosphinothricin acetyltransferase